MNLTTTQVSFKANLNATDKYGETPLHRAAAMGQESTIRTLNQLGAVQVTDWL